MNRRAFLGTAAALAFMVGPLAAKAGPKIVMFGDSLTEGFGLPPKQGLVPRLQAWLDQNATPAQIVNAGLSGDTTYGGRIRIGWSLRSGADGVIVELGGNDLLLRIGIPEMEKNLDSILTSAGRGGRPVLLVGVNPPARVLRGGGDALAAMWLRLAKRHDALLVPDLYAPLWALPEKEARKQVQNDGVHLSRQGVQLVVDQVLGPAVAELLARINAA